MHVEKGVIYMISKNAQGSANIVAMMIINICPEGAIDVIDVR